MHIEITKFCQDRGLEARTDYPCRSFTDTLMSSLLHKSQSQMQQKTNLGLLFQIILRLQTLSFLSSGVSVTAFIKYSIRIVIS